MRHNSLLTFEKGFNAVVCRRRRSFLFNAPVIPVVVGIYICVAEIFKGIHKHVVAFFGVAAIVDI